MKDLHLAQKPGAGLTDNLEGRGISGIELLMQRHLCPLDMFLQLSLTAPASPGLLDPTTWHTGQLVALFLPVALGCC